MNLILRTMTSKNYVLRIKIFAHIRLHLFTKLLCKTSSFSKKHLNIIFSFHFPCYISQEDQYLSNILRSGDNDKGTIFGEK